MPTIEIVGYSPQESTEIMELAKQRFASFPFCKDIVFVLHSQERSRVFGWDGSEQPFVRILTRSEERGELLRQSLHDRTDIELLILRAFYPRERS